ncbi:MAG: DMT family transporter [Clostridia bacterium]|nr:DMT family transporter [Clostridia bacterium]
MQVLLLLIPVSLYGLAWVFMKKYQRTAGSGKFASAFYNMVGGGISFAVLFCISGFSLFWNWQTLICAIVFGCGLALYNGLKVKAASHGPLSLISMSTTLGAVILTMLYGFIFLHEPVTVLKIVAVVLVICSFIPIIKEQRGAKISAKFVLFCFLAFSGNGILTVVSKIAQQYTPDTGKTVDFIALYFFFCFISSAGFLMPSLARAGEIERRQVFSIPAILIAALAVGSNTLAALCSFYLSFRFDSSVQFPILNIGIMIFTTVSAFIIYREKPDRVTLVGLALATAAVVCISLS